MTNTDVYPRISQAIVLVLLLLVLQVIIGAVMAVAIMITGLELRAGDPAIMGVGNGVSFAILLAWAVRRTGQPLREALPFRWVPPVLLLPLIVLLFGLGILSSEVDNILRYLLPMPRALAEFFQNLTGMGIASLLTLAVVAPVVEELLFRGIILRGFASRYSHTKAILVSSLIFCLYHLNPYQFFSAFAVGLILGWIFVRTGSLWPCVVGHALYNSHVLIAGALLPVAIPGYNPETLPLGVVEFQPLWFNTLGLAAVAAGFIGLRVSLTGGSGNAEPEDRP